MKKFISLLCVLSVIFILAGCEAKKTSSEGPFKENVSSLENVLESKEEYNTVGIYKLKKHVVINAKSQTKFFDGAQFSLNTKSEIKDTDVSVRWTTISGNPENLDNDARVVAEIIVYDGGEKVFDKKINFMEKATDAVKDVL